MYQVLKSSWGIRILLTAEVEEREGSESEKVVADQSVWLAFNGTAATLSDVHRQKIAEGLADAVPDIIRQVRGTPIRVVVGGVSYVETDFQEEGLSVAMRRWVEKEFGLPEKKIVESFDRSANRYMFDWC
ncbi:hypothetical protein ACWEFJ_35140 [Actinosynnema sp. NPDC004786]